MAIPVRSIPVLEGEVARKFEREARKEEKNRGSVKFSKEEVESFNRIIKEIKIVNPITFINDEEK